VPSASAAGTTAEGGAAERYVLPEGLEKARTPRFSPLRRRLHSQRQWLIPLAYAAVSILMALEGDELGADLIEPYVSPISSGSAVALLGAIATGMMALTGVVFSLVFVIVQFGSTAYSPRLVRELGRTGINPHALGIFVGTFLFAGLAIHTVDIAGKPGINVTVVWTALAWLCASVVGLVFLVREVQQLTIDRILEIVGSRGCEAAKRAYPAYRRPDAGSKTRRPPGAPESQIIPYEQGTPRYLQALDVPSLVELAQRAGGILVIPHAVGDPVVSGDALAILHGGERDIPERHLRRAIALDSCRALDRDPAYALRLLVDIAIRALSPAINDPTTAVTALDELETLLRRLGCAQLDVGHVSDERGSLRLVYETPTWDDLLSLALTEIQQYGRTSVQVERRLGALLDSLAESVPEPRRAAVRRFAENREANLRQAFPLNPAREKEASGRDRQGLGHLLAATEEE
jgi:uncharacterized membrane protein